MPRISPRRRWLNSRLELLGHLFGTRSSGSSSSSGTGAAPSDFVVLAFYCIPAVVYVRLGLCLDAVVK
jgi:hypothetical protein